MSTAAPSQQKPKQTSRWGSILSGAVAGLESRLDTILAEDAEASARSRLAELDAKAAAETKQEPARQESPSPGKAQVKSRTNDRLQERLAKAMANRAAGQAASEVSTPGLLSTPNVTLDSPRSSIDSRRSFELTVSAEPTGELEPPKADSSLSASTIPIDDSTARTSLDDGENLLQSSLPINPARKSIDSVSRPDTTTTLAEADLSDTAEASEIDIESTIPQRSVAELEAELEEMRVEREASDKQKQDEMDVVLERIDALQAKLQYLAKETVAAAKEANTAAATSDEQNLAAKDEKIALLMEEGVSLSKTELRHLATIRKLDAKATSEERAAAALKKDITRLRQSEASLKIRVGRLEKNEKTNAQNLQRMSKAESALNTLLTDLESKDAIILTLRKRAEELEKKADALESNSQKASLESDTHKIAELEEQLTNSKIEKKLAEDRSKAEVQRLKRELEQQQDRTQASELEMKTEISNLEARMENLRLRAEEASSDQTGDAQAKLLRQIETTQTQYTLASDNWRTIESSLNVRLTAVEKERDEAVKRESELRKKTRELAVKCRSLEEEVDKGSESTSSIHAELSQQKAQVAKLEASLASATKALEDARTEFDQQYEALEASYSARIEEERNRRHSNSISNSVNSKHSPSTTPFQRKNSSIDNLVSGQQQRRPTSRGYTNDSITSLSAYLDRNSSSRRPSAYFGESAQSPTMPSFNRKPSGMSFRHLPSISTGQSGPFSPPAGFEPPFTPSIHTEPPASDASDPRSPSPRGTAGDVLSAATVHTGPSVQLVERMSSSIRRLEAEKAARADELARITAQRDEARAEMVALVREAEAKRTLEGQLTAAQQDAHGVKVRYEACLEMLGEREEEVEELRADLGDMKRIYRELADKMGADT